MVPAFAIKPVLKTIQYCVSDFHFYRVAIELPCSTLEWSCSSSAWWNHTWTQGWKTKTQLDLWTNGSYTTTQPRRSRRLLLRHRAVAFIDWCWWREENQKEFQKCHFGWMLDAGGGLVATAPPGPGSCHWWTFSRTRLSRTPQVIAEE